MEECFAVTERVRVLPSHEPAPGFGYLPINAFLVDGKEPMLVDTGAWTGREPFFDMLWSAIDPVDLRWVFLTHEDREHSGNLEAVLEAAPQARVALNFVAMAKLGSDLRLPPERVFLVNPGQEFVTADRSYTVLIPPVFDSSASLALYDGVDDVLFSSDAFGGFVPRPVRELEELELPVFLEGLTTFNLANAQWLRYADLAKLERHFAAYRELDPEVILSVHAPVIRGKTRELLDHYATLPAMDAFVGPDDVAFRALLRQRKADEPRH